MALETLTPTLDTLKKSKPEEININGSMLATLAIITASYQISTKIVADWMADEETVVENQASVNTSYNNTENGSDGSSGSNPNDPFNPNSNSPTNFHNCYYMLQNAKLYAGSDPTDYYSEWGALANGDSTKLQNYNQQMTSVTQQLQQTTNQNTTNEQSILGIGNAITGFLSGFLRYIQA